MAKKQQKNGRRTKKRQTNTDSNARQSQRKIQDIRKVVQHLSRLTASPSVWGADEWESAVQTVVELRQTAADNSNKHENNGGIVGNPFSQKNSSPTESPTSTNLLQDLQDILDQSRHDKDNEKDYGSTSSANGKKYQFETISPEKGNGLIATETIEQGDIVMSIPQQCIIQPDWHSSSARWYPYQNDRLLQTFPSVLLTLELLAEATAMSSSDDSDSISATITSAYINTLPHKVPLPLYYGVPEFRALQATSAFPHALRLLYHSIKQYCYLYQLLYVGQNNSNSNNKEPTIIPEAAFTFSNFLWAMSIVTSRQNIGPTNTTATGKHNQYVLIPGWDLINHEAGVLTTEWAISCTDASIDGGETKEDPLDPKNKTNTAADIELVFRAMRTYQAGEEITMCYGERSNRDFLVYAGFVPLPNNPYDKTTVRVEVPVPSDNVNPNCNGKSHGDTSSDPRAAQLVQQMLGIKIQQTTGATTAQNGTHGNESGGKWSLDLDILPNGVLDGFGWQALLILAMTRVELDELLVLLNQQQQDVMEGLARNKVSDTTKLLSTSGTTVQKALNSIRDACQVALQRMLLEDGSNIVADCIHCDASFRSSIQRFVASEQENLEACISEYSAVVKADG